MRLHSTNCDEPGAVGAGPVQSYACVREGGDDTGLKKRQTYLCPRSFCLTGILLETFGCLLWTEMQAVADWLRLQRSYFPTATQCVFELILVRTEHFVASSDEQLSKERDCVMFGRRDTACESTTRDR